MGRTSSPANWAGLRVLRPPAGPLSWPRRPAARRPLRWEPAALPGCRVAFFTKDRSFDTRKVRERLGYAYRYTTEEGLRSTTRWYVAQAGLAC